MSVSRIYVEKKPPFAVEAASVLSDLKTSLQIAGLTGVRVLNRYDVEGLDDETFRTASATIFSEPPVDTVRFDLPAVGDNERLFASEYLPGQFDQRADSCAQCIQFLTHGERPRVATAKIYILSGDISDADFDRIKGYLINPVESREASLDTFQTLDVPYAVPQAVETLEGFTALDSAALSDFVKHYGLAMDDDDIRFCQDYFKNQEKRDPTITEIRMIDTYWSDHCRHTTFLTQIENVKIDAPYIADTYREYLVTREELYAGRSDKPVTLMDLAVIAAKKLKKDGLLRDLDESEEINACSVKIKVDTPQGEQDWLLMFKNETHNHPTEIEPFGGAATCLGGAIRDPLSGRAYVYQAMRVTGAGNPLTPVRDTIEGKLPQRKITVGAAQGYSSYGNQIGLATGHVAEIYHEGYTAKRMEIGAVIAAAPAGNVVRTAPLPGDVVLLLGGKTGRDGCGGATGSSKSHTLQSLESCGAEVQKGNAPEERKLQRLFRNPEVTCLIKRCNDFGAGGVSVAIGELADGLSINLDAVPKKYEGLDGTELAISESQERMAVVVDRNDVDKMIAQAAQENLLATPVAVVTEQPRLTMSWNGNVIVDLSRDFLNSNGAPKHTDVEIPAPTLECHAAFSNTPEGWKAMMADLNICSQKGLVERFDSTIGGNTVLMPFGGKTQLTPQQAMAAKIPVMDGRTTTCSLMGWGFNPFVSQCSPYHGAALAVVESVSKVVAAGGNRKKCWLTFQEYFERTQNTPSRWGKPMAALLGAYRAQLALGIGSIGGKDSMSGTFEHIDVPPTLVSFAVSTGNTGRIVSAEFKEPGSRVVYLAPRYDENGLPDFKSVKDVWDTVQDAIAQGSVRAAWTVTLGGIAEAVAKMGLGNRIGFAFDRVMSDEELFVPCYGAFVLELSDAADIPGAQPLGRTVSEYVIRTGKDEISLDNLQESWESTLEPIFPYHTPMPKTGIPTYSYHASSRKTPSVHIAKPRVLIPVFPGTNCEYDTARVFEQAGAVAEVCVVRNLSSSDIESSLSRMEQAIRNAQIVMLPGGFSGGDEPDGSGKFITSFFRNPRIQDAVHDLLKCRDGLMLGICNGFQALIKLGLVPYGEIVDMRDDSPTLTFNTIGRHQSMLVRTRIASNLSPWLMHTNVGDVHTVAISHGEGRFVATDEEIARLAQNGQIASQYVDLSGCPTNDIRCNPNNAVCAIEGITSPDGRVLGKMAHSERFAPGVFQNVDGNKDQMLFQSGVEYFL